MKANIKYLSSDVEELDSEALKEFDGILIPGGFGERGFEGKLDAIDYAIENDVPLFGICLGMQSMVTQFARRNGYPEANSSEFGDEVDLIIDDGDKKGALPSTLVAIENGEVKVLRQGSVKIS